MLHFLSFWFKIFISIRVFFSEGMDEFFFGCHREACASSSRKANKVDSRDVHCLLIGDGLVDERER